MPICSRTEPGRPYSRNLTPEKTRQEGASSRMIVLVSKEAVIRRQR